MIINQKELFSPKQLAETGLLSLVSQWHMRRAGKLTHLRIGRKIFYRASDIETLIESSVVKGTADEAENSEQ